MAGGACSAAAPGATDAASSCQAGTGQLTIATGNATGVYYALGGGLASRRSDSGGCGCGHVRSSFLALGRYEVEAGGAAEVGAGGAVGGVTGLMSEDVQGEAQWTTQSKLGIATGRRLAGKKVDTGEGFFVGHDTGLFTYGKLRDLCECAEHAAA